ncbi:MAG: RNA polymerase sigma factor [Solirubrobacterales bacterium]|nr:RNA polymerase sigma factor [Solirubrobacterales bacterium]
MELIRSGHDGAFEVLFNRYNGRLLGFCQSMLKSRQDAEDVLQEVFTNAHSAMLGDDRKINVRPWLYRIARNRCLNHLRKPVPEGQDSMDVLPHANGTTTAEHVQMREDLRQLMADVETLPETQRTALLLREIEQLSYEEIAQTMQTTVPSVKSLLVRARIGLAESGQARMLTCEEVQLELAEAAEGIGKVGGPARKHVRDCESCHAFRDQLRSDRKAMAALVPVGLLAMLKHGFLAKLFGGGSAASTGAAGAVGGASASGGIGGVSLLGGAIGAKAAAGFATAAILTAGAVEVRNIGGGETDNPGPRPDPVAAVAHQTPVAGPADAADQIVKASVVRAPAHPDNATSANDRPQNDPASQQQPPAPAENAAPADAPKHAPEAPIAGETAPDDGSAAVGTPVDPATGGEGGQDTGSAPADDGTDPVIEPETPTVPTVPTTPQTPPAEPPAAPPAPLVPGS